MSLRITILGYFGRGNLGDEALLACSLDQCRRRAPGAEIVVLGHDPGRIRRDFGVASLPAVGASGRWKRLRTLARSDLVLVGGGGLFKDWGNDSATMSAYCLPALWAWGAGRPVAITGAGVGPVRHPLSRRLLAAVSRACDLVWVRDDASRRWIERCGGEARRVRVAPDPVFAMFTPGGQDGEDSPQEEVAGPERIGVSLRHWYRRRFDMTRAERDIMERLLDRLAQAIARLVELSATPLQCVALPFRTESYDDDARVLQALASRLPKGAEWVWAPAEATTTPARMASVLRRIGLTIGMRLHACILSAAVGTPFVALAYDEKVEGAAASLGREGDTVSFRAEALDRLPDRLASAWGARRETAEALRRRLPEVRSRIEECWSLAFGLLGATGGHGR